MQPVHRYIMLAGRLRVCFEKTLKGKQFGGFFLSLLLLVLFLHSFCVSYYHVLEMFRFFPIVFVLFAYLFFI